jgi:hypothetical protein
LYGSHDNPVSWKWQLEAEMPAHMKDPAHRQRRNKVGSGRVLTPPDPKSVTIPPLPEKADDDDDEPVAWHPLTVAWWIDTWTSPMAQAFEPADIHGLFILAVLIDAFWEHPTPDKAAEIRLQRQPFGLTPIDRNRLQWVIDRPTEEATKPKKPTKKRDPRAALRSA